MRLLFKPFALIVGLIASRLAITIFDRVWSRIDGDGIPDPAVREDSGVRAVAAAALQSAIFGATSAATSRYGMHVFEHVFGSWPGKHREDKL
ncbi:MAG: DUF4235 domain-containing protein [Patulibacter sp.]|nr:DUF4235 domain-containing protein [Patulibacter sp.]